jgi:hypothetical protein
LSKEAVYKLGYKGRIFYRLGLFPRDSRNKLAKKLKVAPEEIEILDGGRKQ